MQGKAQSQETLTALYREDARRPGIDNGGRWQVIKIPITDSYTCADDNDQAKCWVRIRLTTTSGAGRHDYLGGGPRG